MAGELEKYILQFKDYVNKSGIKTGEIIKKPQKLNLNIEEAKKIEIIEKAIQKNPETVVAIPYFDRDKFHKKVLADVIGVYGVKNECTIAYEAKDKGFLTSCKHISEAIEYWEYLDDLYENCFAEIWGYGYAQALDEIKKPGCPSCSGEFIRCGFSTLEAKAHYMGDGYRTSLRDLKTVKGILDYLKLAEYEKADWKKSLGITSLYQIGVWARYLR